MEFAALDLNDRQRLVLVYPAEHGGRIGRAVAPMTGEQPAGGGKSQPVAGLDLGQH